jgi:CRISPR-associated endonuclease/helicase Cas3
LPNQSKKYIAHKRADGTEQSLETHLQNVADKTSFFSAQFGCPTCGSVIGYRHDAGKYSAEFQTRIKEHGPKVDHSTFGAIGLKNLPGLRMFLGMPIACHHTGLINTMLSDNSTTPKTFQERMSDTYVIPSVSVDLPSIKQGDKTFNACVQERNSKIANVKDTFAYSFYIRMLLSCLVDADYLDTEAFMTNNRVQRGYNISMLNLRDRLNDYIKPWLSNTDLTTVGGHRTQILKECITSGTNSEQGLFTLTVPTGGGKTVSSLAFALNHAIANKLDRIIYVIPYTSIIEQNAQVFRNILGEDIVLEHHSSADFDDKEGIDEYRLKLATENWDIPVIVTTSVQFFTSFYATKTSKVRKLHNVANSVVIFDEVQMLPRHILLPCLKVINTLVSFYNTTTILCTATQPAFNTLGIWDKQPMEICHTVNEQFAYFDRVTYEYLGDNLATDTFYDKLITSYNTYKQVLCIVDSKQRAQKIFDTLQDKGLTVMHLSASMTPYHRKRAVKQIKDMLANNVPVIVVATTVVEAGVDLDFPIVYRQIAGMDSIIQAAGRCNRNGNRSKLDSFVYIFDFAQNKSWLKRQVEYVETLKYLQIDVNLLKDINALQKYFSELYNLAQGGGGHNSLDDNGVLDCFSKFTPQYIDASAKFDFFDTENGGLTLYIDYDLYTSIASKEIVTNADYRVLSQHAVSITKQRASELQNDNIILPAFGTDYCFVLINPEYYDTKYKGLLYQ